MNPKAAENILQTVADLKYSEWRAIVDMVERQFRAEHHSMKLNQANADKIMNRMKAERPELFE